MNTRLSLIGLGLAIALFLAINLFAAPALRGVRADLTEQKLYTLSEGTRNILRDLEEPITLRFFFAKTVANEDAAPFVTYAERVREMLEEYVALADGKIDLEVIDPEPYSEAEELAVGYGIQGRIANSAGDRLYLGLVGTNSVDDEEVLPFLDPSRETFLEYELTEMIDRLENPELPIVGLVSSLPLRGGMQPPTQPGQQPQRTEPWAIMEVIERRYELRELAPATLTEIPDEVDLLLLIHPKGLTEQGQYAIDQFCLRGGKVVAFVDPYCYFDPARDSQDPMAMLEAGADTGIDPLLAAWGVALEAGKVAGDDSTGLEVTDANGQPVKLPLAFGVTEDTIDEDDIMTAALKQLRFFVPGALGAAEDKPENAVVEMLMTTTEDGGGTADSMLLIGKLDAQRIADSFVPDDGAVGLAVRISGTVRSAFPDGAPESDAPEEDAADLESADDESEEDDEVAHLSESAAPFNALVIADADMLYDPIWSRPTRDLFGNVRIQPLADNAALLVNALENLSGSSDLISLRTRADFSRPFTRKQDLANQAQERYRAEELELEAKLAETEQKLTQLQTEKDPASALILSPEQEEQLQTFREEQLETRRRLRQVKRDLRSEIDALGSRLKLLNIFLIPAIVAAAFAAWRLLKLGASAR
ncbi:MAG: GldG family protein [Planctomycetota bacterium]